MQPGPNSRESTFLSPPPPTPPPLLLAALSSVSRVGPPSSRQTSRPPPNPRTGPDGRGPGCCSRLAASRPTSAHAPSGIPPPGQVPVVGMVGLRLAGPPPGPDT
ncbi:hypothetical protein JDV02_005259 [Purpureocillium takamizusanense]|uniref:Uncharacterized protein n=1 Tax=Purpureocillium takamizusanense TaxID=2060973 RepID=A0A9Q8VBM1_9HYPO|nr:uncharacterized protein JDV02_005259 [Purpureocillium takamizusanense]UNI19039.1 hypothetical protein JDV02_005259 [Purpureocillium takamizusanense]